MGRRGLLRAAEHDGISSWQSEVSNSQDNQAKALGTRWGVLYFESDDVENLNENETRRETRMARSVRR